MKKKQFTYDVVQEFLKEIFTSNTNQNEKTINEYLKQKSIKIENQ